MRFMKRRVSLLNAGLLITIAACEGSGTENELPPPWAGTYDYYAEGAKSCTETGATYTCACRPTGHYEGTLTLGGTPAAPTGQLVVRACYPDSADCDAFLTLPVIPWMPTTGDGLLFCAGKCADGANWWGDGHWQHVVDAGRGPQNALVGTYRRGDGSIRGCGGDQSTFVATPK